MACCIPTCPEAPGSLDEYCDRHRRVGNWYGAGDNRKGETAWRRAVLGGLMDVVLSNYAIIQKLDDLQVEVQIQNVKINERWRPVDPPAGEATDETPGQ